MASLHETAKKALEDFNANKDFEYGDKGKLASRNKAADTFKSAKKQMNAEDPFAKLDRDLPKGDPAMKVAEPLGAITPEVGAAAASGLSKLIGPAAGAIGMLIPSPIADEELDSTGHPKLTQQLKGNPKIQDMTEPTAKPQTREEKFMEKFQNEGRKHMGPDFSLGVEERNGSETGPMTDKYKLNIKSDDDLSDTDKMKIAGIHALTRGRKGMKKPYGGEIDLPKSDSRKVILEGDDE